MKTTSSTSRSILTVSIAGMLLLAAGCATRGYQRAAATSTRMEQSAAQLQRAQTQIIVATTALDSMVNQPQQDLRPSFKAYRDSVAELEETLAALDQRTHQLAEQKKAYLATWDQRNSEIQNPDIRDRSLQRQREVTTDFARAEQAYQQARESLQPLLTELRDIQRLLSVDLTAAGVASIRDVANSAHATAQSTRQTLGQVSEELRAVSATLDPQTLSLAE